MLLSMTNMLIRLSARSNGRVWTHIEPHNTQSFNRVAGTPSHDSNITKSRLMASHTCTALVVAHQVVVLVGSSPCSITRESNDRSRFRMGTQGDNLCIGLQESWRFDMQLPCKRRVRALLHRLDLHAVLIVQASRARPPPSPPRSSTASNSTPY